MQQPPRVVPPSQYLQKTVENPIITDPFKIGDILCTKCGTYNKNVVTFCNKCGGPVGFTAQI